MSEEEIDRKITVILATDVVGYSKHIETDESETVKNLRACEKLLTGLFKKHKGRLFNTGGDSFLAEFSSAVSAVECAVEFQNAIKQRNLSEQAKVKLEFRIGINSGDVIKEKDNLLGDGVNIAARLEALAQSGGITISKSVYDYVKGKTQHEFNDLGVQRVKKNDFHAFDILLDPSQKRTLKTKSKSISPITGAFAGSVIVGVLGLIYFMLIPNQQTIENKSVGSSVPKILVSPINATGVSGDIISFANGVTESMISTFASYNGVRVLSSSTSNYSKKAKMTDQDIRDQYGVSYIIRGSIQVMGENARLNLQVSDLKAFEITVAKKKDFNLQDIFKVQDELSNEILQDLSIDLGVGAVQGSNWSEDFKSMEDFVLFLNWREEYRKFNKKSYINALRILENLKPSYVDENVTVSVMEAWQVYQKLILKLSTNKDQDLERLSLIMDRAIELNPKSSDALAAGALIGVDILNKSCQEAIADIQLAKKLSGTVDTLTTAGIVYERCRDSKNAIKSKRDALNLVPNDNGWFITSSLVFSLYKDNQISEIYSLIGENIEAEDMTARVLALYAFLEQERGNIENAKKFLKRAKEKNFNIKKFKMQFRPDQKPLLEKTIAGLTELESLE